MKKYLIFIILTFVFFSCKKPDYQNENRRALDIGINNAFSYDTEYITHNNNELYLNLDVGIVGCCNASDKLNIPISVFENLQQGNLTIEVESVDKIQFSENQEFSNIIALDVASDWNEIDAFNLRTKSIYKSVIESLEIPNSEVAIGSFSRDIGTPVWIYSEGEPFEQTQEELGKILFLEYYQTNSTSNFFDALISYINEVDFSATTTNKQITVFYKEFPDNQNSYNFTDVIDRAKQTGVKINLVVFGNEYNNDILRIASETGGFVNLISSTSAYDLTLGGLMDKGTPMMGAVGRIVPKNHHIYRLHLKISKTNGNWFSGEKLFSQYEVNAFYTDGSPFLNNRLPFYVEIP